MNLSKLLLYMLTLNYVESLYTNNSFTEILDLEIIRHNIPLYYPKTNYTPQYSSILPEHYNIKLELHESEEFFRGICVATLQILFPVRIVHLYAQKPHVEIFKTFFYDVEFPELIIIPNKVIYDNVEHIYIFEFEEVLSDGRYILNTTFVTFLDNNEEHFLKISYLDGFRKNVNYIASHFYPIGARQAFPCWDDPAFKTSFKISIKHFKHYKAYSNMPGRTIDIPNTHMIWTQFNRTPNIPIYRVAILLIDTHVYTSDSTSLIHRIGSSWYTRFANRVIVNVTQHFELKEWLKKFVMIINHVAISNFRHDSVENWGLVFHRETEIIYDEELQTAAHKVNVAHLIARKVAYQLFSHFDTDSWQATAWVNQGIATVLATDAINEIFPNFRIWDLFAVQIQQESLRLDVHPVMNSLIMESSTKVKNSEINSLFSFEYYVKAPVLLRMLQHVSSDYVFYDCVKKFLRSRYDFWTVMQDVLNITSKYWFPVKEGMNAFTQPSESFVLNIAQYNSETVRIAPSKFDAEYDPLNQNALWIPLSYLILTSNSSHSSGLTWINFTYTSRYMNVSFSNNSLILINTEANGYYRVKYDIINWRKIFKYLNDENYTKIHVLNRAKIIDDAFYFMMKDELELYIFLHLSSYLQRERDYIAWFPMFKALEYTSSFFLLYPDSFIKERMKFILDTLLDDIGYTEKSNDNDFIKFLRQEAARWACIFNVPDCINNATNNLMWHLYFPEKNKLLPWWKKWTYCNGLMNSSNDTWWRVYNKWMNGDDSLMEYLSYTMYDTNVYNYLTIADSSNCTSGITCKDANKLAKERAIRFLLIIAKHSENNVILEYLKETYDTIKPREVSTIAAIIVMINNAYSATQVQSVFDLVNYLLTDKEYFFPKYLYDKIIFNKVAHLKQNATVTRWMQNKLKWINEFIQIKRAQRFYEMERQKNSYNVIIRQLFDK